MRRNVRKIKKQKDTTDLIIKYTGIAIIILSIIVIALFIYSKNINNQVKEGTLTAEQMAGILSNKEENTTSVTSDIGKSVEESKNEHTENIIENNTTISNTNDTNTLSTDELKNSLNNTSKTKNINNTVSNNKSNTIQTNNNDENVIELNFEKPVEGETIRDFSMDNLIFSNTLQEWTTHSGIDIKAEKTTVVKSAEAGTVKTIKNDPRFGLTIIIEHNNGFKTVYSNLLSSEFVVEGENVEKGQSLGTVGNTGAFEIADEPHLHFEIIKDGEFVDPNIYLK